VPSTDSREQLQGMNITQLIQSSKTPAGSDLNFFLQILGGRKIEKRQQSGGDIKR